MKTHETQPAVPPADSQFPILNSHFLRHGSFQPLPERLSLRAGPLSLAYEAGDLRYIRFGEREVIRRIYAAVRDRNWDTVPAVLSNLTMERSVDSFRAAYTCEHRLNEIYFVWQAEITGAADGTIRFSFDGEARSTFLRNRIGFCVLHPIRECSGAACRVEYDDGRSATTAFPALVAGDQPVKGLHDIRAMAHEVEPDVWAELRFEGDAFETEDQRNWIDASYKTFCTPLRFSFPVEVKTGTRIRQSVTLRLSSTSHPQSAITSPANGRTAAWESEKSGNPIEIKFSSDNPRPLPRIGLGASSTNSSSENFPNKARFAALGLAHLRHDVHLAGHDWGHGLLCASMEATMLGIPLELAIHLRSEDGLEIRELSKWFVEGPDAVINAHWDHEPFRIPLNRPSGTFSPTGGEGGDEGVPSVESRRQFEAIKPVRPSPLARIIAFRDGQMSTDAKSLALVRARFGALGVPIGAGTNADFYQLNLERPPQDAELICWSMNPQAHAFDNTSIAETPESVGYQLASAREYFRSRPLVVSPITFKPRFNPVATGPGAFPPPGELPASVDPRQMSLFGAAWTLAMLKHLAKGGASSVTFYETVGWRGVMETNAGSPLPEKFPSIPGSVFPLFHVLADAGEFARGEVLASDSSDTLKVEALAMRRESRLALVLANLTDEPQRVNVRGFASSVWVRWLDETTAREAMTNPEQFRAGRRDRVTAANDALPLTLPPCALARLDAED